MVSFTGVRRRPKLLADFSKVFAPDVKIFLDSGAYSLNKGKDTYTNQELARMAESYYDLVNDNIDRIEMFSEFDAQALGPKWIASQRNDMWGDFPREKFLPVWHPEDGQQALLALTAQFPRVGLTDTALDGRDLGNTLDRYVRETGVKFHSMTTKIKSLQDIKWDSAASTSWLSPTAHGDTIVWTGNELKWYPKEYKEQARKRHRSVFINNGFNVDAIENDDPTELLKLSIWSWLRFEEDINRHGVTMIPETTTSGNSQNLPELVDTHSPETLNPGPLVARPRATTTMLPILGIRTQSDDAGETKSTPFIRSESARACNNCYIASRCPAFEPDQGCAFDIPIEVKTRQDLRDISNALVSMQTQRVMFARFAEEKDGDLVNPNVSQEIDRLSKLIKTRDDMEAEGFSINIQARGQAHSGTISRLFGREAAQQSMALPTVIEADSVIRQITDGT